MFDGLGGKVNGIDSNIPNTSNISQYATNWRLKMAIKKYVMVLI